MRTEGHGASNPHLLRSSLLVTLTLAAVTLSLVQPTVAEGSSRPKTSIASGAADHSSQRSRSATFTFKSSERASTFRCSVDAGAYRSCKSPVTLAGLASGPHTFRVYALRGSKKDKSPSARHFVVRATGPKPTAATTGVPAGTALKTVRGDVVVTKAGTRLDGLDIHGFVIVRAENVRITRSIIRGGKNSKPGGALLTDYGYPGLVVEDTLLVADYPSVNIDGIKGWGFTARRVHVVGNVDSIKVHGNSVTIADSLLENTVYYAHDPQQGGGPTHNDNIQVMRGKNIVVIGNTIRGATNFAILGSANTGDTQVVVQDNYLDGGHCTLKLQSLKKYQLKATATDNQFGPNRAVRYCPIQAEPQVSARLKNNVYAASGGSVPIYRKR